MDPLRTPKLPSFETEDELYALIQEGLDSGNPIPMTPETWSKLRAELQLLDPAKHKLAS